MEDLILSLPTDIEIVQKNKDGTEIIVRTGLCVKYVTSLEKWVCKYGTPRSSFDEKIQKGKQKKDFGIGSTPSEAVKDFIKKSKRK